MVSVQPISTPSPHNTEDKEGHDCLHKDHGHGAYQVGNNGMAALTDRTVGQAPRATNEGTTATIMMTTHHQ